ncbi:MAG: bifunctional oligoribonuclease/PAP phosphatase NrnA [Cyclobacteriaceae bacterium]|nr:bifunctional oligoribonuclease/PAP phosphatase NrnA [Cyclobacteriaceae bacterium]
MKMDVGKYMKKLEGLKTVLTTPKKIVITTHSRPDADALGSSLGLMLFLKKLHHQVDVITPTGYPDFLKWMKGEDQVMVYTNGNEEKAVQRVNEADLIFCLDFSALSRIDKLGDVVGEAKGDKVLIDHHLEPEDFAKYALHSIKAASTAELIYQFICEIGGCDLVDVDIAECLYAGINTDTGSFRHSNVTKTVFDVSAALVEKGADTSKVAKLIYDTNSENRLRLLGYALSENLIVLSEYNTAYFALSEKILKKFNAQMGDTEGLVNYALSIKGIKLAALFKESDDGIKMSFRSVNSFSVNELARTHFNGGGHKNAAGGKSEMSLEDTVHKFENLLKKYKIELTTEN